MRDALDEELVLKPLDPAITDDNEWPNFEVTQVDVCNESTGAPESLLAAGDALPLVVTGRLERLDRGQTRYLVARGSLPTPIILRNVQRFSYGQYPDGSVAFWAAGKAGWYEIRPSRNYRKIYKDMTDAINLLYFAADFYRGMKLKQLRSTSLQTLFANYAQDASYDCADELQARAAFLRHRVILRSMMAERKEDINWRQTQLFKLLDRDLSDDVDLVRQPSTPERASDDDDDGLPSRLAGKGKSSLRPKASSLSGKAAARQAAQARSDGPDGDDSNSDGDAGSDLPSKRFCAADDEPKPRKRGRPPKRREWHSPLPKEAKPALPTTVPPPRFSLDIVESPMPSFSPNRPGDVWACSFDGCAHSIFAATTDQAQGLIKDHYRRHAHECQTAIDLVQREERPYLPVDHLLKRIRDVATQRKPTPESSAADLNSSAASTRYKVDEPPWLKEIHTYPQPIRQKY